MKRQGVLFSGRGTGGAGAATPGLRRCDLPSPDWPSPDWPSPDWPSPDCPVNAAEHPSDAAMCFAVIQLHVARPMIEMMGESHAWVLEPHAQASGMTIPRWRFTPMFW
jgi:hypothetical protein